MSWYAKLPSRPDLVLAYHFERLGPSSEAQNASTRSPVLVVFIGGVLGAMAEWDQVINILKTDEALQDNNIFCLKLDRYGLGESKERNAPNGVQPYDLNEAARDLSELVEHVILQEFKPASPRLILVGHSVGVAIARLYINKTANPSISGILCVDSTMTDTDFVTAFPDPDAPTFAAEDLPMDVSVQDLRVMRQFMKAIFHPAAPNDERLDRSNTQSLLPSPSEPKLKLSNGAYPYVTVLSNDPVAASNETQAMLGVRPELMLKYLVPVNKTYHEGLIGLTSPDKAKGPITVPGSGHWIHKDCPQVVADELRHLIALS